MFFDVVSEVSSAYTLFFVDIKFVFCDHSVQDNSAYPRQHTNNIYKYQTFSLANMVEATKIS